MNTSKTATERVKFLAGLIRETAEKRLDYANWIASLLETGEYDSELAQSYNRLFQDPRLQQNAILAEREVVARVGESALPSGDDILQVIINRASVARSAVEFLEWTEEDDRLLKEGAT